MLTTYGDRPIDNWVIGSVRDWQKKTQEEKGKKETERLRRSNVAMAHPSRDGWAKGKNFNNAPFQIKKWKKKTPSKSSALRNSRYQPPLPQTLFVLFYYHFLVVVQFGIDQKSQRFFFSFFLFIIITSFFQPLHIRNKRYLLFWFRYVFH